MGKEAIRTRIGMEKSVEDDDFDEESTVYSEGKEFWLVRLRGGKERRMKSGK